MRPNLTAYALRLVGFTALAAVLAARLTAEEAKEPETNVAVSVGKILRVTLHDYVTGYGTVETAPVEDNGMPASGARIAAAAPGLIVAVPFAAGARVQKGAVIVQQDTRAADAAVVSAQAAVDAAEKSSSRQKLLQGSGGSSERLMLEAQERLASARSELASARLKQSQLAIHAPLSGTLTRLEARPGEWLDAGKEIGEVADLNRLVVEAEIPAAEADALRVGEAAAVFDRLGAGDGPLAAGRVQFVAPRVTEESDSVLLRVTLPEGAPLRLGQMVAIQVTTASQADVLAVPIESLVKDPDAGYVIWLVENGIARQQAVRPGIRDAGLVQVSGSAVSAGATIVTTGAYGLPKETKVTIAKP